jgi:hypothetical protein
MIIHAVLFALFGIGSLIMAVFGGVQLMIGEGDSTTAPVAAILSGGIIAVIYGATLVRTLRPKMLKKAAPLYWAFMTVVIVATVILAVAGPVAQARLKAEDEVVASALPGLAESINEHANEKGSLPKTLDEVAITSRYAQKDDIRSLIDKDLVRYTPGEQIGMTRSASGFSIRDGSNGVDLQAATPIFHYELCVDYKTSSGYGGDSYGSDYRMNNDQKYDTTITTYGHGKGETCYDVQTAYSY